MGAARADDLYCGDRNCYDVLGVEPGVDAREITQAYRRLAKEVRVAAPWHVSPSMPPPPPPTPLAPHDFHPSLRGMAARMHADTDPSLQAHASSGCLGGGVYGGESFPPPGLHTGRVCCACPAPACVGSCTRTSTAAQQLHKRTL